ncbi:acyltransferase [bacterium]|nr:acyltransferase [bacterium]
MNKLRVAAVQMEHTNGDKAANLAKVEDFTCRAAVEGAAAVAFPECCISSYMHLAGLNYAELSALAESVPGGRSVEVLSRLAIDNRITVLAGLLEIDQSEGGNLYNTYVVACPDGAIFRYRKLHPFVNKHLSAGNQFVTLDIQGWRAGILICYDSNLWENWRIYELQGAQLMFLPHQTGGFDIPCAGMGKIDPQLWHERKKNPEAIRAEVLGPKGRQWLMKWLPSRAYDTGTYAVFSNGCGVDGVDEVRCGGAVVIDPHGIVQAESFALHDDMVVADLDPKQLELSLGRSHTTARRPELYGKLIERAAEVDTRSMRNAFRKKLGVDLDGE